MEGLLLLKTCVCPVPPEAQRHSWLERAGSHSGKLTVGPDISLIGVYPGEIKTHVHRKAFARNILGFS